MDPTYTKITLLLDASGSMSTCRAAVIEGFNAFLREQQAAQGLGRASLTVAVFNETLFAVVPDLPLEDVQPFHLGHYLPHGGTRLLDALGGVIQGVGVRMARLPEERRPARVITGILTDCRVNPPGKYTLERVNHLVRHQRLKYHWRFRYYGEPTKGLATAARLGIPAADTCLLTLDSAGVGQCLAAFSGEVLRVRAECGPAVAA
jgi:hypothetical protein